MDIHQLAQEGKKIGYLVVIHASNVINADLAANFNFAKKGQKQDFNARKMRSS